MSTRLFRRYEMFEEKEVGQATEKRHNRVLAKFAGVGVVLALILLLISVTSPPAGQAAFPGANGKIVFVSNREDGNYEIYVMNADGTDPERLTYTTAASESFPRWSPDGTKIVFESDRDGNYEIYVMNADGTDPERLTYNSAQDSQPAWSPDGSKIAFVSNRSPASNYEIYVMNANGTGDPINLTKDPKFDERPAWSPDGLKIAFNRQISGSNFDVFVMNANGTDQKNLTEHWATDGHPAYSPNGSKIAFHSTRDGPSNIFVMNAADGSGQENLTKNYFLLGDEYPAYSPNGDFIVFTSLRSGNYEIYVMNAADGTGLTNLTNNPATDSLPDWQPLDITPPVVNVSFPSPNGQNGWFITSPVTGIVTADDTTTGGSNITAINCTGATVGSITGLGTPSASASLTVSAEGVNNVSCTATDSAGNNGAAAGSNNTATVQIDTVEPVVLITSPADGGSYLLNAAVASSYTCTDATSGVATCDGPVASGANFSTSPVGPHAFTVTATDVAGNQAQVTNNYSVIYDFSGFFPPIDNPPTLNRVKAGRAIPVKFSLNGDQGLDIFDAGFPASQQIACDASATLDDVEETTTAGSSSLSYDATTDQYVYVWKTDKGWAGACRQLIVQLDDGTAHVAYFNFR